MTIVESLLVIALCMFGHAFFSGMETGMISIHRMRLRHFVRQGSRGAKVLQEFLEDSDRLLGTTLVGARVCMVNISIIAASLASRLAGGWGETLSTVIVFALVLVFCEYIPKTWFHSRPLERCGRYAGVLSVTDMVFRPFAVIIVWLTRCLVPGSSKSFSKPVPFVTREDLKILAREGEKDGILSSRERDMIHRVFELSDKHAHDIMIPRSKVTVVDMDMTISRFLEVARSTNYTRLPMIDSAKNEFTGVINLFYVLSAGPSDMNRKVADFARPPLFVSEDTPVDDILPILRRARQPICFVKNAGGDVIGIITREDILEEIVGKL